MFLKKWTFLKTGRPQRSQSASMLLLTLHPIVTRRDPADILSRHFDFSPLSGSPHTIDFIISLLYYIVNTTKGDLMLIPLAVCMTLSLPPSVPYRHMIQTISCRQGVDPRLVFSIISTESRFRKWKLRKEWDGTTSVGLMQIKIQTARQIGFHGNYRRLLLPWINVYYGVRYLRLKLLRYPFIWDAVSAYNAGRSLWNSSRSRYRNGLYVRRVWKRFLGLTGTTRNTLSPEYQKRVQLILNHMNRSPMIVLSSLK